MKKPTAACAILLISLALSGSRNCAAASPPPFTTLRQIHALTHAEAARQPPVAFEATVTYRRQGENTLFVQDGGQAIFVWAKPEFIVFPGQRVLIHGVVQDSFRPMVVATSVEAIRFIGLPLPASASFDDLVHSRFDCVRVTVSGRVQSADLVISARQSTTHMRLLANGGVINVYINSADPKVLDGLLDSQVDVTGVASATLDAKLQMTGIDLSVVSLKDVKVLRPAPHDPWTLPLVPMDSILDAYHVDNSSKRVRVRGTITYYQPGSALVLQDGARSLWVTSSWESPLRIGSQADVTGLPDVKDGFLTLASGEIHPLQVDTQVPPKPVAARDLSSSLNAYDLVSVSGKVVSEVREGGQDQYVLESGGQTFSAVYRHPHAADLWPLPFHPVPLGATVTVTGICTLQNSGHYAGEVPFDVLMRTPGDIAVVARPSPLNVRNLVVAVGLLFIVVLAVGAKGWSVDRRLRRETASWAAIERSRSRILEEINGVRPLSEVMEQIVALASSRLAGVPCWFQTADGTLPGTARQDPSSVRILRQEIPARHGPPLGAVFAAFDPSFKPRPAESEVLAMAAELATLAIETRRLYSDLRHRSEFDLLTDIHNRFSLENQLDREIERAAHSADPFGLIYIDLDRFKEINDSYGHHLGDLYLQTVASRMRSQLRPLDILARLGGDEFAVLLPMVRTRAEVEEIARRLERCFLEPFALESHILHTSASFGVALYPLDGVTKDSLLKAADAAMYAAKNAKRQSESAYPAPHTFAIYS